MNRWSPYFLSVLRINAAFVYGVHGAQKLFGFPAPFPVPHLPPLFLASGMIETFGGSLLPVEGRGALIVCCGNVHQRSS
jgi:putative oxidoreductase